MRLTDEDIYLGEANHDSVRKDMCSDLDAALRRKWLETNGLGGFASSIILGLNTHRYHGLLVATLKRPVERFVLLSKLEETLFIDGQRLISRQIATPAQFTHRASNTPSSSVSIRFLLSRMKAKLSRLRRLSSWFMAKTDRRATRTQEKQSPRAAEELES
jgi:glycogen debranching enzyme